jgi:hypothetical protein
MVYLCMLKPLHHISEGNSKTECFSFDLPAVDTCPGRTEECERDCYAANLMRIYSAVDAKYRRNQEITYHPGFVDYMVETIPADCEFRIHVSGDFFHVDYVRKWIEIATRRPDVMFYAYTRSWRADMFHVIKQLHSLPNVNINLSVDDETGPPSIWCDSMSSLRWCYLTKTDAVPDWIRHDDIVFRSNHLGQKIRRKNDTKKGVNPDIRSPLVKRLGGQVCPLEQGRDIPNFSCKKCRLCVDKPDVDAYVREVCGV